jgi:hypothetical protein
MSQGPDSLRPVREPTDWAEADLEALVRDEVPEGLHLDYKDSRAFEGFHDKQKNELAKDVSAFANSDGGVLVIGIQEKDNKPVAVDEGLDPTAVRREAVEQVIQSRIQQRIDGVRVHAVPLLSKGQGRVAYVISVPASDRAPHMAHDNKYYKRYDFTSLPMQDYEVRDVSNRRTVPRLAGQCEFSYVSRHSETGYLLQARFSIKNEGEAPAYYTLAHAFIDVRLDDGGWTEWKAGYQMNVVANGAAFQVTPRTKNLAVPGHMPIWNGPAFTLWSGRMAAEEGRYLLGASFQTPGAGATQQWWFLDVEHGAPKLTPLDSKNAPSLT